MIKYMTSGPLAVLVLPCVDKQANEKKILMTQLFHFWVKSLTFEKCQKLMFCHSNFVLLNQRHGAMLHVHFKPNAIKPLCSLIYGLAQ
jgi:hypothetical protein